MKKFLVFFLVVICVIITSVFGILCKFKYDKRLIYVKSDNPYMMEISRNLAFCLEMDEKKYKNIVHLDKNKSVIGESFVFKGDINLLNQLINKFGIDIKKTTFLNNQQLFFGYCSLVGYEKINGFNVQVSYCDENIVFGFPIIYGEY